MADRDRILTYTPNGYATACAAVSSKRQTQAVTPSRSVKSSPASPRQQSGHQARAFSHSLDPKATWDGTDGFNAIFMIEATPLSASQLGPDIVVCLSATYCLSKSAMSLISRPFASMPVVVAVAVLPSRDTTTVLVWTNFPAFVRLMMTV
jgi:hypothetical protein